MYFMLFLIQLKNWLNMNEILIGNISRLGNPDTFDKRILVLILKVGPQH